MKEIEARIEEQTFTADEMDEINDLIETVESVQDEIENLNEEQKARYGASIESDGLEALHELIQIVQTPEEREHAEAFNEIEEAYAF
ncbi:hypothetical protein [Halorubrum vacuolatum]|uniref:Uncharacterized protein n=1 Tax=Halorubrum vacuolatum TaxID=63740 RepID=A0A238WTJ4_HALVU|nr:hypothetical protein [Halorubrum vacuolatum]SNR49886.1 hypothetical protein SAMN06264855_11030 [Halorubrum vacuolatum]